MNLNKHDDDINFIDWASDVGELFVEIVGVYSKCAYELIRVPFMILNFIYK